MKEKLLSALLKKPYFLVLLPLFFISHGYNEFFGFFPLKMVVFNFILTITGISAIFVLSYLYLKNKNRTSIFTFLLSLFVLTFGTIHDTLKQFTHNSFITTYKLILPAIFIATFLLLKAFKNSNTSFSRIFPFLNLLFIIFLGFEIIDSGYKCKQENNLIDNRFTVALNYKPEQRITASQKPDIFFFVFDGMPSTKAMQKQWSFDNSALDSFLLQEKFYIATHARSNYNITMLSVSSSFNMEYLLPSQIYTGGEASMIQKASPALMNNSLTKILRKEDYEIYQYQPLSTNNSEWDGQLFFVEIMSLSYYYKTLPGRLDRDLSWHLGGVDLAKKAKRFVVNRNNISHKKNILYTIDRIKTSCKDTVLPKFVYGHFMLPHEPFIFDSTGNMIKVGQFESNEERNVSMFMNQVKYANKVITDLIKHIKRNNKKNTIIIVEGDHGYRNIYGKKEYLIFDNLNAIYYPDQDYSALTSTNSPVNTFRLLLNKYFYTKYPRLIDTCYYIPYTLQPKDTGTVYPKK